MALNVEYLDKCNLRQACEWIAFGWQPTLDIYKNYLEHESSIDDLKQAKNILALALFQKKIKAWGKPTFKKSLSSDDLGDEYTLDLAIEQHSFENNKLTIDQEGRIQINIFYEPTDINILENILKIGSTIYNNIEIDFNELKNAFPAKDKNDWNKIESDGYTTPFLEIMVEVIKEQGITFENQGGKKEFLERIFEQKLKDRGLESNNKAKLMATFIRIPQKQVGGNTKITKK